MRFNVPAYIAMANLAMYTILVGGLNGGQGAIHLLINTGNKHAIGVTHTPISQVAREHTHTFLSWSTYSCRPYYYVCLSTPPST